MHSPRNRLVRVATLVVLLAQLAGSAAPQGQGNPPPPKARDLVAGIQPNGLAPKRLPASRSTALTLQMP